MHLRCSHGHSITISSHSSSKLASEQARASHPLLISILLKKREQTTQQTSPLRTAWPLSSRCFWHSFPQWAQFSAGRQTELSRTPLKLYCCMESCLLFAAGESRALWRRYIVCGLKTHLHLSQCYSDPFWKWFGHNLSSIRVFFMLIRLQSSHRWGILMAGIKGKCESEDGRT